MNTRCANLEAQTLSQQAQLEALSSKKRKRVQVNPNTKFANIESIKRAQEAAALLEVQEAQKQVIFDAQEASRQLQQQSMEELQFEWHI